MSDDLRWICKQAVLEKWFMRSLRPQLRKQMLPSAVHSYGFKPTCRTTYVTGIVRQLLYLASEWNLPLLVAAQDVQTAFDSMQHDDIAAAMVRRGINPGMVAAHLRELSGLKAFITLPGVGDSPSFVYNKGGKQGGIETPDEWNILIDDMLGPLVEVWNTRFFWT